MQISVFKYFSNTSRTVSSW